MHCAEILILEGLLCWAEWFFCSLLATVLSLRV